MPAFAGGALDYLDEATSAETTPGWDVVCLAGVCYCLLTGSTRPPWEKGSDLYSSRASRSYSAYVMERLALEAYVHEDGAMRPDAPVPLILWMRACLESSRRDLLSAATAQEELGGVMQDVLAGRATSIGELREIVDTASAAVDGPTGFDLAGPMPGGEQQGLAPGATILNDC